jgi:predicted N-acetyltransferase YhbS
MIVSVRRLRSSDDRSGFRSGQVDLDRFFLRFAGQNQFRHHLGTTYVALDEDDRIVGFATVSASRIDVQDLPLAKAKRLPQYPLPVLRLARLATHEDSHGAGVGSALLRAVFVLAHQMARDYGCVGVLVDAKSEAVDYYERFGFFELDTLRGALGDRPAPTIMFLELGAIPKLSDAPPGD